ncbi:MAG: hypothetical protein VR72_05120 [Clostridiaceae bacterium BRH_c20a]|nr:MAG: hypothetical protein VR72_05120 [Clostridiaceae bacterium BRH_c20a]
MAINLLPPKYKPKPTVEWKRLNKILLISITALAIGFLGANYYFFKIGINEKEINLQANIDNLKPVFNKIEEYDRTQETLKTIEAIADKIGKAKETWSDILADVAGSLTDDIWFIQITKEEDRILIEGEAQNFSAVGNLAVNIRKLPWFKQVDVNEAETIEDIKIKSQLQLPIKGKKTMVLTENVWFKITAILKENITLFVAPEGSETK